jgi:cysteine-S-conjugate beta-lyase
MSFFNDIYERKNTNSVKWDKMKEIYQLDDTSDILPMWVADMDFAAPQVVVDALQERLNHPIFGYTYPDDELKVAIANWYTTRHHWTIDPKTMLFHQGVIPAIASIVETFTNAGDKIGMSTPIYPPFFNVPKAQQREIVTCELTENNGAYEMDFKKLEQLFQSGIQMYILCNPHNPAGIAWSYEQLQQLIELCIKYDVFLLADEIHADLTIKKAYTPILTVTGAENAKIISCIAPTKTFNLAGIHAAMTVSPNKNIRLALEKSAQAHGSLSLNTFACTVVKAVYTNGEEWLDALLPYLKNNMDYVVEQLNAIDGLHVTIPDATYLMWIDYRGTGLTEKEIMNQLLTIGKVALDPGTKYSEAGRGFLRINVACPLDTLKDGIERIKRALA